MTKRLAHRDMAFIAVVLVLGFAFMLTLQPAVRGLVRSLSDDPTGATQETLDRRRELLDEACKRDLGPQYSVSLQRRACCTRSEGVETCVYENLRRAHNLVR